MTIEAIVVIVIALTQTIKSWFKNWFNIPDAAWRGWYSVILSFFVSIGVAIYAALKTGQGLSLGLIWVAIAAWALANGGKKLLNTLK